MEEPVNYKPLTDYLAAHETEAITGKASMLSAVADKLKKLDPEGTGSISINNMEELRQMAGRLTAPGTPNTAYIGEVKGLMDAATAGKGGVKYQQARRMYENYSNEFKNTGVIDKLMSKKPGTNDRSVAFEDVFDHTVLKGSLDDLRNVRRTLQTAGPEGQQAWRELQGQGMNHLRDLVTSNVSSDIHGNPIVSVAKLNRFVNAFDKDGKLDFFYGKKGAERIRDLNDVMKDVGTSPPGSVNSSNTASALANLLDLSTSAYVGLPLPIATGVKYGVKRYKSNKLSSKVNEAMDNK